MILVICSKTWRNLHKAKATHQRIMAINRAMELHNLGIHLLKATLHLNLAILLHNLVIPVVIHLQ
jgi:hypothetical protein